MNESSACGTKIARYIELRSSVIALLKSNCSVITLLEVACEGHMSKAYYVLRTVKAE